MKKYILYIFMLFIGLFIANLLPSLANAQNPNLISNPGVESYMSGSTAPINWQNSKWGQNTTTFQYSSYGQNSSRSLGINITNYTDGDAKWYFNPVNVLPNTNYYFSDYYTSNVTTETVAQIQDQTGSTQYLWLADNAVSYGSWNKTGYIFKTPANAKTLTVFHLINKKGYLQTDNFVLKLAEQATITNNVPNNSVEQVSDLATTQPLAWANSSWGTNATTFSYLTSGHTGTHSIKTQITSYTNGDAKWYYTPQSIEGGKSFQFSDYYKSTVSTKIVAMITKTDGSIVYQDLGVAPISSAWAQFKGTFATPADAATLTIFHLISAVGSLVTDDYAVTPYVTPTFNNPLISITFDDGWESQYINGLPVMMKYQLPATYYLISSKLGQPEYLTKAEAVVFQLLGSEIGSHSLTHPFLTQLPLTQMLNELSKSKTDLENNFGKINSFAVPYDDYNDSVINSIKTYYQSARVSDLGYNNRSNFDAYRLKTQNVTKTTTLDEVNSWIAQAKKDNSWLILLYHQVDNSGGDYSVTPANFDLQLSAIKSSGIKAETVNQALSELLPQISK